MRPRPPALPSVLVSLLLFAALPAFAQHLPPGNNQPPQPQIVVTLSSLYGRGCGGWLDIYSATYTGPTGTPGYQWSVDGTTVSGATSSALPYVFSPGSHTLSCTVTVGVAHGTGTLSLTITNCGDCTGGPWIWPWPDPNAGCVNTGILFWVSSGGLCNASGVPQFSWTFGDGGASTQAQPTHTYTQAGNYTATLTITLGNQTATQSIPVVIIICPGGGGGGSGAQMTTFWATCCRSPPTPTTTIPAARSTPPSSRGTRPSGRRRCSGPTGARSSGCMPAGT